MKAENLPSKLHQQKHVISKTTSVEAGGCVVAIAQWSEQWLLKPVALCLIPSNCLFSLASLALNCISLITTNVALKIRE